MNILGHRKFCAWISPTRLTSVKQFTLYRQYSFIDVQYIYSLKSLENSEWKRKYLHSWNKYRA